MTATTRAFHAGELLVQQRAGVSEDAARLEGMLRNADLDGRAAKFLAERTFAVLTARDGAGRLWTVPLVGPPGFLRGQRTALDVRTPHPGPLADLDAGSPAGLITLDFAGRRRIRINGTVTDVTADGLRIEVNEAFGNCPSYIQARAIEVTIGGPAADDSSDVAALAGQDRAVIEAADTFFLGSVHPVRGADSSHKGGRPGFVRVDTDETGGGGSLWWPDYSGNNMFNSLGNVAENPEAALLFLDFTTGAAVQLSGTAELEWIDAGSAGDDDSTGRRVRFRPSCVVRTRVPLRADAPDPSPANPELRAT